MSSNHIVRGCSEGDDTGEGRGDIKVPLDLITRIPALRSFTVKGVRAIWRWPADRHVTFPALEELDMLDAFEWPPTGPAIAEVRPVFCEL